MRHGRLDHEQVWAQYSTGQLPSAALPRQSRRSSVGERRPRSGSHLRDRRRAPLRARHRSDRARLVASASLVVRASLPSRASSACPPSNAHEPVGATTASRASSRWWATSLRSRSSGTPVSCARCRRCSSTAVRNARDVPRRGRGRRCWSSWMSNIFDIDDSKRRCSAPVKPGVTTEFGHGSDTSEPERGVTGRHRLGRWICVSPVQAVFRGIWRDGPTPQTSGPEPGAERLLPNRRRGDPRRPRPPADRWRVARG